MKHEPIIRVRAWQLAYLAFLVAGIIFCAVELYLGWPDFAFLR